MDGQACELRPLIFIAHCLGGLVVLRVGHPAGESRATLIMRRLWSMPSGLRLSGPASSGQRQA